MAEFLVDLKRTHDCGALRASDAGKRAVLFGWVAARRDHGGCVFIDLRDRGGLTQIVFEPETSAAAHTQASELRREFCIGVAGTIRERGGHKNPKLPTGDVELAADTLTIFSVAETPPFELADDTRSDETIRLKHRYLDLRRPALQKNFIARSQVYQTTRRYLADNRFLEIETPFMVKYTPGGARNFLVPSRLNPGQFYALAESPQIFKQLFMVAGMDRYFQIVRCFRDEDLRLDRQPEFTQIDLEMSFVTEDDVQNVVEGLMVNLWKDVLGIDIPRPFQRLTYADATGKYGSDKPDLRFELPLVDLTEAVKKHDGGGVGLLQSAVNAPGGVVKGWRLPAAQAKTLSRADLDKLEEFAKGFGARGLARARIGADGAWAQSPMKTITDDLRKTINEAAGLGDGDLLFLQFGAKKLVNAVLGGLRLHLAAQARPRPQEPLALLLDHRLPAVRAERRGEVRRRAPPVHLAPPRRSRAAGERSRLGARARLRPRAQRQRDRRRLDPDPPVRRAGARLPRARPHRRRGAGQVRLPARGVQVRPAAARRDRRRRRSSGDAPLRRRVAARRDRLPQDAKGDRPHDRRARAGGATSARRAAHRAQGMTQG